VRYNKAKYVPSPLLRLAISDLPSQDFIRAFVLGFDVDDAIALIRMEDL